MAKIIQFPDLFVDDDQQQTFNQQQIDNTLLNCIHALQFVTIRLLENRQPRCRLFVAYEHAGEEAYLNLGFAPDDLLTLIETVRTDAEALPGPRPDPTDGTS
jgi:hypothetical protein